MSSIVADERRGMRPQPPCARGLRRRGASCCVPAPRRWVHIAFVAAPCISPRGARNATRPLTRTDSKVGYGSASTFSSMWMLRLASSAMNSV